MRGRKPEPEVIVELHPGRAPAAPRTLGPLGRAEWRKVAPILARGGLMAIEAESLLVLYCQAVEGAMECARIVKKQGRIITQNGLPPKAHPAVRQELQYQAAALRYAESLGITATAKARRKKGGTQHGGPAPSVFD